MGNLKRRKFSVYLEKIKKGKIFSKCQKDLYKSLGNVSRGIFRTYSEIYDGAFLRK